MADIRINLLSTATSSIGDDFLPIDGTTNGTRKLSAFSPSFGGNVVVGGNISAGGAINTTSNATPQLTLTPSGGRPIRMDAGLGFISIQGNSGGWATGVKFLGSAGTILGGIWGGGDNDTWGGISIGGGDFSTYYADFRPTYTKIFATTASTNASSGALVVGNGTQGGLGVGGSIHLGENLNLNSASGQIVVSGTGNTANSKEVRLYRSDGGDWAVFGLTGTAYAGSLTGLGNSEAYIYNALPFRIFIGTAATNRFDFASNQFKVNATTSSTDKTSGAVVISGGLGVAKRIYSGEGLNTEGDNATHISLVRNGTISIGPTSAATPKLQVGGGLLLANTTQSVPAYGDVGPQLSVAGAVITDTSSSGTVSRAVVNSIAASALAASSTTTYTAAASLFVAGAPTANTNVTITNAYAIYTAGGRINFQGLPTSSAGLQAGTLWNDAGTLKVA